jgi:uroporphyrinogen decarboxylase
MFGPHIIEEFLKPEYERIFQFYREHHVLIRFHSCGYVEPLLDMFIRLGVDILHPVQATANNLDHVREVTQGHMAMEGCIPSHLVLDGPIEDIEAEVGRRIRQLGQQGGFFCRPDQTLDYPKEHVGALEAAVRRCGTYPLT